MVYQKSMGFFHHNTGNNINITLNSLLSCPSTSQINAKQRVVWPAVLATQQKNKKKTYFGAALIDKNETKTCEANQSSWRISQLYKKTKTMLKRSHDSLLPCQIFLRWNSLTSNPVTHHLYSICLSLSFVRTLSSIFSDWGVQQETCLLSLC